MRKNIIFLSLSRVTVHDDMNLLNVLLFDFGGRSESCIVPFSLSEEYMGFKSISFTFD